MSPDTWKEWMGVATTAGGVALGAWKYGARISTWCRATWTARRTAAATRAEDQQAARGAVRALELELKLRDIEIADWQRREAGWTIREADLCRDIERGERIIVSQDRRIAHLETELDGLRR